jgi:hypothetical protein
MLIGADPDQLDALGNQLDSWALTLDQIRGRVGGVLEQLLWQGADAHEFFEQWADRFAGMVGSAASGLREEAQCLHAEAAQQRAASDGGTGSGLLDFVGGTIAGGLAVLGLSHITVAEKGLRAAGFTGDDLDAWRSVDKAAGPWLAGLGVAVDFTSYEVARSVNPNSPDTLKAGVDLSLGTVGFGLEVAVAVGAPEVVGTFAVGVAAVEGANDIVSHFDPQFDEQVLHVAEKPDVIFASGVKGALSLVRSNPLNWVPAL